MKLQGELQVRRVKARDGGGSVSVGDVGMGVLSSSATSAKGAELSEGLGDVFFVGCPC